MAGVSTQGHQEEMNKEVEGICVKGTALEDCPCTVQTKQDATYPPPRASALAALGKLTPDCVPITLLQDG